MTKVAIVGGGVSGLSAAFYLSCQGIRSILIEKSPRVGGLIRTDLVENCRLEAGPDSYLSAKTSVTELAQQLGELSNEIIPSNDAARRVYIVRRGKLVALPHGMSMMVPGRLLPALTSELFSIRTKLKVIEERFARPRERSEDISIGQFVGQHFGDEWVEYLAEPLLSGVYGGSAARLSAASVLPRFVGYERTYGSLIRGVQREAKPAGGALFHSFANGMQSLTDALRAAIEGNCEILQGEAQALEKTPEAWRVQVGENSIDTEELILACPAHACARLLEGGVPELADELSAIPYSSAILITLLFDAAHIAHPLDGFGFLVPPPERKTIAAATWINRKFPARIAPGLIAIRVFIVGDQAVQLGSASDSELTALAQSDLARLMGIGAAARHALISRWPNSMPQYVTGHAERIRRIQQKTRQHAGLHLIGNAYEGVGIPDCVRLAKTVATHIAQIKSA